ncbi:hypothetical protein Pfo_001557 [Paulownia fortunei]|nr:hypothetical protein Pfo_001557 [Paulownia fortunei]
MALTSNSSLPETPTGNDNNNRINEFCDLVQGFDVQTLAQVFGVNQEIARKLQRENDERGQTIIVERGLQVSTPHLNERNMGDKQYDGEEEAYYGCDNGFEETICTAKSRENIDKPSCVDIYNRRALHRQQPDPSNSLFLPAQRCPGVLYRQLCFFFSAVADLLDLLKWKGFDILVDLQYEKLEIIGYGGFGEVYKYKDLKNNEIVAIKWIPFDDKDEGLPYEVLSEISLLKELDHGNVVRLFDVVDREDGFYLVFEHLSLDLATFIDDHSRTEVDPHDKSGAFFSRYFKVSPIVILKMSCIGI